MLSFGRTLQALRKRAGLTQRALAAKLGVTQNAISWWERDAREPSLVKLRALFAVLGVDCRAFFGPDPPATTK